MPAKLRLRQLILLPSAILVAMLAVLLLIFSDELAHIKKQNEAVRQLSDAFAHSQGALSAAQQMRQLAQRLQEKGPGYEENTFSYFEQYGVYKGYLGSLSSAYPLTPKLSQTLAAAEPQIRYRDDLNPAIAYAALHSVIQELHAYNTALWVEKRASYIEYYNSVNSSTQRMAQRANFGLFLAMVVGGALTWWVSRTISQRLKNLVKRCGSDLKSEASGRTKLLLKPDEITILEQCVTRLREQLSRAPATENILKESEGERRRIAMDFHDQILADLTHVMRELHLFQRKYGDANATDMLRSIESQLNDISGNIRRIMDDLHPQVLDVLGLQSAVESYLKKIFGPNSSAYRIVFDPAVENHLDDFQKLNLYRIAVEALNNAVRHAQANRYEVSARLFEGSIILSVADNGCGFNLSDMPLSEGRGVFNIRERALAIGAQVSWGRSRFSRGTLMEVSLAVSTLAKRSPPIIHAYS